MTNRELLELAALAAGYSISPMGRTDGNFIVVENEDGLLVWNPLKDDGDCARLETRLLMYVEHFDYHVECMDYGRDDCAVELYKDHGDDKYKARRFASVRCAAEIGRRMKERKG